MKVRAKIYAGKKKKKDTLGNCIIKYNLEYIHLDK